MGISDYSTTPGSNTAISGINIAENCAGRNINDAIRQLMADLATFLTGPSFTGKGTITRAANASTIDTLDLKNAGTGDGTIANLNFYAAGTNYVQLQGGFSGGATMRVWINDGGFTNVANFTAAAILAGADNVPNLGSASKRFGTVYAGTGTINTSDENEKDWRGSLTAAELRAAKRIASDIGAYRWLAAIAEKGDAARYHVGVRAQQVIAILEDEGLEPFNYGFVCYDEWDATPAEPAQYREGEDGEPVLVIPARPATPAGSRYGIRPDELAFFILAGQEQRLSALEAV